MINYRPANFDDHRHYSTGDILVALGHVISQDHLIKHHLTL